MNFENLKLILKKHKIAVIFAFIVGFLMIAPQLIFISNTPNYNGLYMMKADAEVHYLARMKEFVDAGSNKNPYFYEYKDVISPFNTISEPILALPASVLPITVPKLNLLYKFLLPAIIFILVYILFLQILSSKKWSIVGGLGILLGNNLMNLPDIIHFVKLEPIYSQFALYSRPVNPEFSSIIFFTYLIVLFIALKKRDWWPFIFLGLIFGFSFYVYLYSFTFIMALNFVFALLFIIKKNYNLLKKILVSSAIGLVIGAYEIYNIILITNHPFYEGLAIINNIKSSHLPIFSIAGLIITALFIFFIIRKKCKNKYFLTGLLVASWLVINQQILTGVLLQSGHYHWYFNTPIYIIILFWLAYNISPYFSNRKINTVLVLLSMVFILNTLFIQYSSYEKSKSEVASDQEIMPAIDWLKLNTPAESVVLANQKNSNLIPIFTDNYVAWSDYGAYYLIPKERRAYNYDAIIKNPLEFKSKYKLDYIFWDKKEDLSWNPDKLRLETLYSDKRINIYDFKSR